MKNGTFLLFLGALTVAVGKFPVRNGPLQGVWTGPIVSVDIPIITEEGFELVCVSSLPPECQAELPAGRIEVEISGRNMSFNVVFRDGVTPESSATHFPICAQAGVIVTEGRASLPVSEITYYDAKTGHLKFIDPRRPEEVNCAIVLVDAEEEVPRLSLKSVVTVRSVTTSEIVELGLTYRCTSSDDLCVISTNEDRLTFYLDFGFDIPCVGGACLTSD